MSELVLGLAGKDSSGKDVLVPLRLTKDGAVRLSGPARALSAVIDAVETTPSVELWGSFNVSISGVFTGSIALERSFDNGANWLPLTDAYGTPVAFTAPISVVAYEPEEAVLYRAQSTVWSAGSASVRLSQ